MDKDQKGSQLTRRTILKAFTGIPVLGLLGFEGYKKIRQDSDRKKAVLKELGLDSIQFEIPEYGTATPGRDLIRVGIIGFGSRGTDLARSLGFMHPDEVKNKTKEGTLESWLRQEDLDVAITGICDVFDRHAEKGLTVAAHELRSGVEKSPKLPVKRYRTYQDMLADKDIDAVVISTPDHHHARMAADAVRAGKHVYCEKSVALVEEELHELYKAVKESNIVFQLGHQNTHNVAFQQARAIIKQNVLGKITLVETTTNRNSSNGAWIRHLDADGNPKPGDEKSIDWKQWLGNTPYVPFDIDRFYNWTKWFAYDSGLIGQLFTHEYDAVNQLLHIGIPKSASSSGGLYYWKDNREMPDSLHCVFEYPGHDLTLTYSGNLASSLDRGRVFIGHDASMTQGATVQVNADRDSTRYKKAISSGLIDPETPILSFNPGAGRIDAVTSATAKYYASRGLTTTTINGREVDVTHLHLREWLHCIRNGTKPSADIEMAFQEGITCIMAHRSYIEKRQVEWDAENRRIV